MERICDTYFPSNASVNKNYKLISINLVIQFWAYIPLVQISITGSLLNVATAWLYCRRLTCLKCPWHLPRKSNLVSVIMPCSINMYVFFLADDGVFQMHKSMETVRQLHHTLNISDTTSKFHHVCNLTYKKMYHTKHSGEFITCMQDILHTWHQSFINYCQ